MTTLTPEDIAVLALRESGTKWHQEAAVLAIAAKAVLIALGQRDAAEQTEATGLRNAIDAGGLDIVPCGQCGVPVATIPEGLALCVTCAEPVDEPPAKPEMGYVWVDSDGTEWWETWGASREVCEALASIVLGMYPGDEISTGGGRALERAKPAADELAATSPCDICGALDDPPTVRGSGQDDEVEPSSGPTDADQRALNRATAKFLAILVEMTGRPQPTGFQGSRGELIDAAVNTIEWNDSGYAHYTVCQGDVRNAVAYAVWKVLPIEEPAGKVEP